MHRGREEEEEEEPFLMFRARVVCCDSPVCGCGWVHGCVVVSSVSCVCVCVCVSRCRSLCWSVRVSNPLYVLPATLEPQARACPVTLETRAQLLMISEVRLVTRSCSELCQQGSLDL
mmetsp:Transcript_13995/g.32578  ORF Transcript_13995/g.32578 Transcript_13995/m.32578 type:complete len:117 (+) Transcript_13995:1400-1750(+)